MACRRKSPPHQKPLTTALVLATFHWLSDCNRGRQPTGDALDLWPIKIESNRRQCFDGDDAVRPLASKKAPTLSRTYLLRLDVSGDGCWLTQQIRAWNLLPQVGQTKVGTSIWLSATLVLHISHLLSSVLILRSSTPSAPEVMRLERSEARVKDSAGSIVKPQNATFRLSLKCLCCPPTERLLWQGYP